MAEAPRLSSCVHSAHFYISDRVALIDNKAPIDCVALTDGKLLLYITDRVALTGDKVSKGCVALTVSKPLLKRTHR
jgi:hypothetical protein